MGSPVKLNQNQINQFVTTILSRLVQFMSKVVLKSCNWTLGWILSLFRVTPSPRHECLFVQCYFHPTVAQTKIKLGNVSFQFQPVYSNSLVIEHRRCSISARTSCAPNPYRCCGPVFSFNIQLP